METLRTAIDIKNALDNAPKNLKPIGKCEQTILEWKLETYGDGYDEEEDKKMKKIQKLKDALKGNFCFTFEFSEEEREYTIKLGEYSSNLNIDSKIIKEIYEKAEESPFGDVKNLETKVDKNIRDAREIKDIQVDPKIIQKIEQEWSTNMIPSKVKVVPYKLNMYSKDGKFEEHLDTPEKDLIGTALISLWNKSTNVNSYLTVYDINRERSKYWDPETPECIMFYTDCPHKVQSKYRKNENIRATLAFKIFADGANNKNEDKIRTVSNALQPFLKSELNLGFILGHSYSLSTEGLKGSDLFLLEALKRNDCKFVMVPILYHFTLSSFHGNFDDADEFNSVVYPLREEEIDYLMHIEKKEEAKEPSFQYKNVDFYILSKKYHTWKNLRQSFCEFTGNESRAEDQDSIYLSRALIVYK